MTIKEQFEKAVKESKELPEKPDNQTLLKLYSLYKQATEGDQPADAEEPNMFDFVNKAKYEAWKGLKGKPSEEAMTEYVNTVSQLQGK